MNTLSVNPDRMHLGLEDCESVPLTAAGVQIGDFITSRLNWRAIGKVIHIGRISHNRLIAWEVETLWGTQELVLEGDVRIPGLPGIEF